MVCFVNGWSEKEELRSSITGNCRSLLMRSRPMSTMVMKMMMMMMRRRSTLIMMIILILNDLEDDENCGSGALGPQIVNPALL